MAFPFFVICLAFGYWLNTQSWNGVVYVYLGSERSPAAVRKLSDYTPLDIKSISKTAQEQLLAEATLFREERQLGISLGHPILRSGGSHEYACQVKDRTGKYDRMELVFMGDGIAESGTRASLTVETPCRSIQNLNKLETIWLPMAELVADGPRDRDMQTYGDNPVNIRLENIPQQWPDNWELWSVRLFNEANPEESLSLDAAALHQSKELVFDWK